MSVEEGSGLISVGGAPDDALMGECFSDLHSDGTPEALSNPRSWNYTDHPEHTGVGTLHLQACLVFLTPFHLISQSVGGLGNITDLSGSHTFKSYRGGDWPGGAAGGPLGHGQPQARTTSPTASSLLATLPWTKWGHAETWVFLIASPKGGVSVNIRSK